MNFDSRLAHTSNADILALPTNEGGRLVRLIASRKWVWIAICLFNLILVGLCIPALTLSRARYEQRAFSVAETISHVLEQNLLATIEKIDAALMAVSDEFDYEQQSGRIDDKALDQFIARNDKRIAESVGLRMANAQGFVTHAVTGALLLGSSVANYDYFMRLRDNPQSALLIDGPFIGVASQTAVIILARRLNFPDGQFAGEIHSTIPLDSLNKLIAAVDPGQHGAVAVINEKLTLIARKPSAFGPAGLLGQTAPSIEFQQIVASGAHSARYQSRSRLDHIQRTIFFRHVGSYPLMVNVGVSSEDYLVPWWNEVYWVGGLILFFILVTSTIGLLIDQRWKERELAIRRLAGQEQKFRTAFETNIDGAIVVRSDNGRIIEINQAFSEITGFQRDDVLQKTTEEIAIWAEPRDRLQIVESLRRKSLVRNLETRIRLKSGKLIWALISAWLVELDGVSCILSVARDISELKSAQDEIKTLAYYDPLTNLPNRRLLLEYLGRQVPEHQKNKPTRALLFVDLDHFKTMNDTLGHEAADGLLRKIARRLAICVRTSDMVGRLGGDEFVVLLESLSKNRDVAARQAERIAEKIRTSISQSFFVGTQEIHVTTSIGITLFLRTDQFIDNIFTQADIAMYQAKALGRNKIQFFSPELQQKTLERSSIQKDLQNALSREQFILHYQPQTCSGRIVGAEALIRWNHPERGVIFPGAFISVAEETGLILPIGQWVLLQACRQIVAWSNRPETASIVLAINVSARQFRHPGFVDEVLDALERSGATPENLKLEITESMLLDDIEDVVKKMNALKARGLSFSLDDFGTGYSSLSYLKRLPLDQLKIDQSFVRDLGKDPNDDAIVETIIALGQAMGLSVIAEGVETKAQQEFLSYRGCNSLQGYLFGRPVPVEMFESQFLGS